MWTRKAERFKIKFHFSNCLAAVGHKLVILWKPLKSGSDYFNYKQSFSIVLMSAANAEYEFAFVDIGTKGRFSDVYTFRQSNFGQKLLAFELSILEPAAISEDGEKMPFVFVGDEAFPLMKNLICPYSGSKINEDIG